MLTAGESRLRIYLMVSAGVYAVTPLVLLVFARDRAATESALFVVSVITVMLIRCGICWYAGSDLRRSTSLVRLSIWTSIMLALAAGCVLHNGGTSVVASSVFGIPVRDVMYILLGINALDAVVASLLHASAERQRYALQYFMPHQFRTIVALAEVVIHGDDEVLSPEEVARNVDRYFKSFQARSKWTMALVISVLYVYPLLSLKPPLPFLSPDDRLKFLRKRFYRDVEARLMPEFWRVFAQGLIRIAKQLCYIGYYNDKRTFASVGYVPFSERGLDQMQRSRVEEAPPLHVKTEKSVGDDIEGDVVLIGSGAAASILAKGLVESGRKVVMIERGNYERPETFTENEMEMVSRLFQDGAIQAARDFRFTVFQGSCVGGSTVVNNAVCFKMPEAVLDKWNETNGVNAGLDRSKVLASMDRVWDMIGVTYMDEDKVRLNPGGYLFKQGCKKLGLDVSPNQIDAVNANISGCFGCGYCNIGCRYNKKLSMIVSILPGIQKRFPGGLDIIAGCEAMKLIRQGNRIASVECRFGNGRKLRVRGKTFVVSAGAVSSSILLLRSKLGVENVGKSLSFNIGSQMTAVYPQKVDSFNGLQISHYLRISPDTGYVMESWFNPPMFQSTAMPGWFEDHYNNMRRYDRLACVGLLVGSEPNARVRIAGLTGREIEYTPTSGDFQRLLSGLELSGEIMLASGATSVMPNTFRYHEFGTTGEVRKLHELVKDPSEIALGTGHPQGGNIIGSSPSAGVVDPEFKVFGYNNLYVCDASVFPTSLGVNPQLTVMGLADYAVPFVTNNKG